MEMRPDPDNPDDCRIGKCDACGAVLERWRGQSDISCDCGAEYNASGQRLRGDWRANPSNFDDEIGDMEGYEIASLRRDAEYD